MSFGKWALVFLIAQTAPAASSSPAVPLPGTGRIPEGKLSGVTLDSVDNLPAIMTSLKNLSRKPTTRIVFDEWVPASDYREAVRQIYDVSFVMGEILDSFYVPKYTTAAYSKRVTEYLNALGDKVDIWEVGNEINGEWVGTTADVVAKMTSAYDLVKARGLTTELTLYYNEGCFEKAANEMFTWADANVPTRMKTGLDYVLVSYYEDDCNGRQPNWPAVFERLGAMFPQSRIGFGEVGTTKAARKKSYLRRYYSTEISHPHYIGGYFWWYGRQDFVPSTKPLWSVFNELLKSY